MFLVMVVRKVGTVLTTKRVLMVRRVLLVRRAMMAGRTVRERVALPRMVVMVPGSLTLRMTVAVELALDLWGTSTRQLRLALMLRRLLGLPRALVVPGALTAASSVMLRLACCLRAQRIHAGLPSTWRRYHFDWL